MSERENSPPFQPFVQSHVGQSFSQYDIGQMDGQTDGHTRFSVETLNPKPGHTQEDTHFTE
jgi:hypothetical protein